MKQRRRVVFGLAWALLALAGSAAVPVTEREIDNVAAFARLYGVVRYFYPSDSGASLDWDRFAVLGVKRLRAARDSKALRDALESLYAPLGPGIEIGSSLAAPRPTGDPAGPLVAWRYLGAGFDAGPGPYAARRTHRSLGVEQLRGKTIRLRGQVRATARDNSSWAALWLRVDRPNGTRGFFDNMDDRRIREAEWREYTIEGTVAEDAVAVAFGAMAFGSATADFDAVELCAPSTVGDCTRVSADPGFEAELSTRRGGWMRAGTARNARISQPASGAPAGRQFLRIEPPPAASYDGFANVMQTLGGALPFEEGRPTAGAHADVDLGSGQKARMPLALSDAQARGEGTRNGSLDALKAELAAVGDPSQEHDPNRCLADVVVAWNVFRHFYPYWPEAGVEWDARLRPQLVAAGAAPGRAAQRDVLRALVADARDGHGSVTDTLAREERARLPIQLGLVQGKLVIVAGDAATGAHVGAVVAEIDGMPGAQRLAEAMRLVSGTTQWKQARALRELTMGPKGAETKLVLEGETQRQEVSLRCEAAQPPPERRPEPVTELEPQIWYVDLTRAQMAQVTAVLEKLAGARGVVFDVRGYPGDAGARVLPHLIDSPESDRWMHVAKLVGPFGGNAGWQSLGWDMKPAAPRLAGKIVFLTDGRAISYAESVMGYVADRKLGTIVGSATAGTNGNVASFAVPSGFRIGFTGMRVTGHDGRTPFHLLGVQPDVAAAPTVAGLRSGRDEVLERGVAIIR